MCTAPFWELTKGPVLPTAGVRMEVLVYEHVTDFLIYERFMHYGMYKKRHFV